jgi:hypothetical protein
MINRGARGKEEERGHVLKYKRENEESSRDS